VAFEYILTLLRETNIFFKDYKINLINNLSVNGLISILIRLFSDNRGLANIFIESHGLNDLLLLRSLDQLESKNSEAVKGVNPNIFTLLIEKIIYNENL